MVDRGVEDTERGSLSSARLWPALCPLMGCFGHVVRPFKLVGQLFTWVVTKTPLLNHGLFRFLVMYFFSFRFLLSFQIFTFYRELNLPSLFSTLSFPITATLFSSSFLC